jgi:hypothetical protein
MRPDTLDLASIVFYLEAMAEDPSKRLDDVHKRLDDLRRDVNQRFAAVDRRFDAVDRRFDAVDRRFDRLDTEFRDLRADMRSRFRWTVTTMVALFGAAVPVWMWVLGLILRLR